MSAQHVIHLPGAATIAMVLAVFIGTAGSALALVPPLEPDETAAPPDTRAVAGDDLRSLDAVIDRLTDRRAIFIGETHDRYEDHLDQLAVIRGLHDRGVRLAIGMEFFQQPFQAALDAFVAGEIDEGELLRRTEYFDRWRYDYRLYRPILRFARDRGLPLVALNLSTELTRRIGDVGIEGLAPEERAAIPAELDRDDPAYRERLEAVFALHPAEQQRNLEHFIEVQLAWDEGMAERAARYLREHPERTLVILTGYGHVEYGQGIPKRLLRRLPVSAATLVNGTHRRLDPSAADFFLFPQPARLPPAGLLGVLLTSPVSQDPSTQDGAAASGARVRGFGGNSGAKDAGVKEGDRIVAIDGRPVADYADVRIALIDARPGERVQVEVERARILGADERLTFEVELR